jgi:hypothetical protein
VHECEEDRFPKETVEFKAKFVPTTVIIVPPRTGPDEGTKENILDALSTLSTGWKPVIFKYIPAMLSCIE